MNLKFIYNVMKNTKKGKTFLISYFFAAVLDKIIFFSTLTLVETSFKDKVYKKYLRFRLKNIDKQ